MRIEHIPTCDNKVAQPSLRGIIRGKKEAVSLCMYTRVHNLLGLCSTLGFLSQS